MKFVWSETFWGLSPKIPTILGDSECEQTIVFHCKILTKTVDMMYYYKVGNWTQKKNVFWDVELHISK